MTGAINLNNGIQKQEERRKRMKSIISRVYARRCILFACSVTVLMAATLYAAPEPIVFPAKGQSNEQMEKDKYACYTWAKGQTGFDPMQAPTATAPPPPAKGGVVKGAAKGAVAGVAIGAVAGDAGQGAAIGATAGGIAGAAKKNKSQQQQQQAAQQQAAGYEQKRGEYNRGWSACMEGKGYTVK
jgi:hypothetical protein